MGRKLQGARLRAKKRQKEIVEKLQESQAERDAERRLASRQDDDLFVVDTQGDAVLRGARAAALNKANKEKKKKVSLSEHDQELVDKLAKQHSEKELKALAEEGRKIIANEKRGGRRKRSEKSKKQLLSDIWDDVEEETGESTGNVRRVVQVGSSVAAGIAPEHMSCKPRKALPPPKHTAKALFMAHSGQSFNPDPTLHQTVLQTALKVEQDRLTAVAKFKAPLASGLSKETKALMAADDDDSSSSSEDESDIDDTASTASAIMRRKKEKYTRTERNKQKRQRRLEVAQAQAKAKKRFLNSVSEIPRFKKEFKREEQARIKKQETKQLYEQAKMKELNSSDRQMGAHTLLDPIHAPTLPVALTSDLKSESSASTNGKTSLRTMKPKGCLVEDRLSSWRDRQIAPRVTRKRQLCMNEETQEQPHVVKNKRRHKKWIDPHREKGKRKDEEFQLRGY